MKLYVASSWRNPHQPELVRDLRVYHEVYDFRHPPAGDHLGFSWSDVDPDWTSWTPEGYLAGLEHPIAQAGFESDFGAMEWADAGVLVLPCGRSAHLEAGWFVGAGKPLFILLDRGEFGIDAGHHVTELMYRMATKVYVDRDELLRELAEYQTRLEARGAIEAIARVDPEVAAIAERDKLRMVIRNAIENIAHGRYGHAIKALRAARSLFE